MYHEGDAEQLVLYLPELLCAGRVYINGVLAAETGSLQPYHPLVRDCACSFTAGAVTEILVQCANYTHYYSGMYYPPAVGTPAAVWRMVVLRLAAYGLLCFASLAVALVYVAQWLLWGDAPARWLGLLCLAFSVRVAYPFWRGAAAAPVRPLYALEDLAANAVLLFALLLAADLYGAAGRAWHRLVALPAAVALCAASVVFPLCILPHAPSCINLYGGLMFGGKLAAGLYLAMLGLRARPALGGWLCAATGLYGATVAAAVLGANRFEPILGAWPDEYGGFVLVTGFAVLMSRRNALLTAENRRLTQNLQAEVARKTQALEQLLAERRELLGNLVHDIKNPLTALRTYAELVHGSGQELDAETAGYLDALAERADRVEERLNQLQAFSRAERRAQDLPRLCLNDCLRTFHTANRPDIELPGQKFLLKLPREPLYVRADEEQLRTALENLCYNALSFTGPGDVIALELTRRGQEAVIAVWDTGTGIDPRDLPHLFERGFSHRADGSGEGLGLYIVRSIALELGGTVQAQNRAGQGSLFAIRLPLAQ